MDTGGVEREGEEKRERKGASLPLKKNKKFKLPWQFAYY